MTLLWEVSVYTDLECRPPPFVQGPYLVVPPGFLVHRCKTLTNPSKGEPSHKLNPEVYGHFRTRNRSPSEPKFRTEETKNRYPGTNLLNWIFFFKLD